MAKRTYKPKFTEPDEPVVPDGQASSDDPGVGAGRPKIGQSKQNRQLSSYTTDGDLIDIWERRILNPNEQNSTLIQITTPGMRLRWVNMALRGRYQRARNQGWVPVQKEELVDDRQIYGVSYSTKGEVHRGERQQEMLMKMPEAVFRKIQQRKKELSRKSYEKIKESLASAGSAHFGDKYNSTAGQMAADAAGRFVGSVQFGTEQASSDELME